MARITPGRRTSIGTIGAGMVLLAFSAFTAPASAATNPTPFDGNPSCLDLGLSGFKIDAQPEDGTYTTTSEHVVTEAAPGGTVPASLEIEIDNVVTDATAKTVTFDWHATTDDGDFSIDVVLVKFANGGLRWDYAQPGQSADTAWSTQDSISHVSFCFDANTGGTDGNTDTGTGTGTGTGGAEGTTTGGNQVLGETVTRGAAAPATLPVTGSEDVSLAIAGVALIALGSGGLVMSSRLRRSQGAHFA